MGNSSSKYNTDSLNWDKINTESMSSVIPNLENINKDAKKLVTSLIVEKNVNNFNLEDTDSDNENLFSWVNNKIGNDVKEVSNKEDVYSDTSPFISSDMYKYLADKNSSATSELVPQQGGAKKSSSTSSTSSTPRKNNSSHKGYDSSSIESNSNLSYISSSAHTENKTSDIARSSISVQNNMLSSSVNTSDINYISNRSD